MDKKNQSKLSAFLLIVATSVFLFGFLAKAAFISIENISLLPVDEEPNNSSSNPAVSADGQYVAFSSDASNLVGSDNNDSNDVFVYNISTGDIERVSISNSGVEGDDVSSSPSISSDGRYVAFSSDATNLVAGDNNASTDVFVYDRNTDTIERVSVDDNGTEGDDVSSSPSISSDGRYVSFSSNATNLVAGDNNASTDVFVYDRNTDTIERVSVDDNGAEGNNEASRQKISDNGRYVVFDSSSTNLVAGDTNGFFDVFIYDRDTDTIERVSVDDNGAEGDADSTYADVSSDGRYVVFNSAATNLVAGDTNGTQDVFVYDRNTDTIERVSVDDNGVEGDGSATAYTSISSDGRYVGFTSSATNLVAGDTNGVEDTFRYDRDTDTVERISVDSSEVEGDDFSRNIHLSGDAGVIVFQSEATNLVAGDSNLDEDVFIRNISSGTTSRIERNSILLSNNQESSSTSSISYGGRYVAFYSSNPNLVNSDTNNVTDVFIYDIEDEDFERASVSSLGVEGNSASYNARIAGGGGYVAFESSATNLVTGDTNGLDDVFVYDITNNTTERVSVATGGTQANGSSGQVSMSFDGRYVSFNSTATNLVAGDTNGVEDIFIHDRDADTTERISVDDNGTEANSSSYNPFISSNGRYVAFDSYATNLVANDLAGNKDVFVYDRDTDTVERISLDENGTEGNADSETPAISTDGRYVVFKSAATNLVAGDTNGFIDIFLYDRDEDSIERISVSNADVESNADSTYPRISPDGRYIVFTSESTNLVTGDTNASEDVFLYDTVTSTIEIASLNHEGEILEASSFEPDVISNGYVVFNTNSNNTLDNLFEEESDGVYLAKMRHIPNVSTTGTSSLSQTTATLIGNIVSTGGSVTSRGFNYGLTDSYGSNSSESGSYDLGEFTLNLSGLTCNTTYHFRAFATNSIDTKNGTDSTFSTSACSSSGGGGGGALVLFLQQNNLNQNPIPDPEIKEVIKDEKVEEKKDEIIKQELAPKKPVKVTQKNPTKTVDVKVQKDPEIKEEIKDEKIEDELKDPEIKEEIKKELEPVVESKNNQSLRSKINESFLVVGQIFKDTKDQIEKIINTPEGNIFVKTATILGVTASFIASLSIMLFMNPIAFSEIYLIPVRVWSLFMALLGIKKKNKPWGTVYDSVTKQPLDPAYVTLEDLNGNEVSSMITDIDGRYGFLVSPGQYRIFVKKTNYNYPSSEYRGIKSDILYNDLYFGEIINIEKDGEVLTKNIPLDPVGFDWNEFAKKDQELTNFFMHKDVILAKVSNILFSVGFTIAVIALVINPLTYNIIITSLYILLFILKKTALKPKPKGLITQNGQPLSFAVVRFYNNFGVEINHKITDVMGNLLCLIPNGVYTISIESKQKEGNYLKILENLPINIQTGYFDKKIDA